MDRKRRKLDIENRQFVLSGWTYIVLFYQVEYRRLASLFDLFFISYSCIT